MLNAGYWHTNYWPEDYWQENYWQDFGTGVPTDNMHLIGANLSMNSNWLPDVNTNTLFEDSIEAKGTVFSTYISAVLTNGGVLFGGGAGNPITAMDVLSDGEFIVGDGTTAPVAESGNTARTSLGLGTSDSVVFNDATLSKSKLTPIGGFAVKLTNKTGGNTVAGQLVKSDTATDDGVRLTAAADDECFGVFLDSGVADESEAWVVVAGIADVAMEDNTAATHGNWVETSDSEAGYANATSPTPNTAPAHFEEIGHCIESVSAGGAGTHILSRCVLHFN